jgi:hypothetical protein
MNNSVFIIVPAYEETRLIDTLRSCIDNAVYPERLRFAVALQYKELPEPDLSEFAEYIVGIDRYDVDTRPGLTRIRYNLVNNYFTDEEFFMSIDAHNQFDKSWDETLYNDYAELVSKYGNKVVYSKQVADYYGKIDRDILEVTRWEFNKDFSNPKVASSYGIDQNHTIIGNIFGAPQWINSPDKFVKTQFISMHLAFAPRDWVLEVGVNPDLQVFGEETFRSIVSYMAGWDTYARTDYNHLGHMPKVGDPNKKHMYDMWWDLKELRDDPLETVLEQDKCIILNDGKFSTYFQRAPFDFWNEIGYGNLFPKLVSLVKK